MFLYIVFQEEFLGFGGRALNPKCRQNIKLPESIIYNKSKILMEYFLRRILLVKR